MGDEQGRFYTVRGYELIGQEDKILTSSMEDYLEMICRLVGTKGYTRISDLAAALNVQPPSASKMVQRLADASLVHYQKYGLIKLTEKGKTLGEYLLYRHATIERFLKLLGVTEGILEATEKIEHSLSKETVTKISHLLSFFEEQPHLKDQFARYSKNRAFLRPDDNI
ncbi:Iron dependent repressor, diptheria toxin type [Syntrophomonas zehnderi OL-4]|uniref:Manganese transport regulator n=1 Tax=Syntrophomonas zehnderi OL-4 TaxID=690567 RepID=A0A0E4G9V9_9FIRM|nr:transcriptional regulator MntR [Syntrophomonas zehnderi]CFX26496.1 Iron dependent repressor, diptheria toxin type [Syntrophomonas zehnderi OL-4]